MRTCPVYKSAIWIIYKTRIDWMPRHPPTLGLTEREWGDHLIVDCANKGGLGWLVLTLECILTRDSQFRNSGHELIASQYSTGFIYFNLIGSKCYHWSGPCCKNLIWINSFGKRNWFNDSMPNRHWQHIPIRILHASSHLDHTQTPTSGSHHPVASLSPSRHFDGCSWPTDGRAPWWGLL